MTVRLRRSTAAVLVLAVAVAAVLVLRSGVTGPARAAQAAGDRYRAGATDLNAGSREPGVSLELGQQFCALLADGVPPGTAVREPALMAQYDANRMSTETRWRAIVLAGAVLCTGYTETVLHAYWTWHEEHA